MIDAKRTNLILLLFAFFIIISPPQLTLLILLSIALAVGSIMYLRLAALTAPKTSPAILTQKGEPFVSIVIACANEPAELLGQTLSQMSQLDYKAYEVLVLDNNNDNESNWRAIERQCKELGSKFRFLHVDKVHGYKAGALNLANRYVSAETEILAIVDADYLVEPDFLSKMTVYFQDPKIGIVQAPQDYDDGRNNPGLYSNYRSFFSVYMNQSQHLDTVTFTGTMGMIRRSLFQEGLCWNEWCITEDTEAGIYIHVLGYSGVYIDEPFGRGLMPFSYHSLIKQRSRWSYGNMQIIRKNLIPMLSSHKFSTSRKIGFLSQLIAWIRADLLLYLVLAGVLIRTAIVHDPISILNIKAVLVILLFSFLVESVFFLKGLGGQFRLWQRLAGLISQYGLLFTMSYGWLYQLLGGRLGFMVTKKSKALSKDEYKLNQEWFLPALLLASLLLMKINALDQIWLVAMAFLLLLQVSGVLYLDTHFRRSR